MSDEMDLSSAVNDNKDDTSSPVVTLSDLAAQLGISEDDVLKRIATVLARSETPGSVVEERVSLKS